MILKHVHLFGLLLLSLLLASFLGKYINIGEDSAVDGFENTHTGGKLTFSQVDDDTADSSDNVVQQPNGAGGGNSLGDGLGVAFDNILPANIGNTMETFISPIIGNFEGLANDDRDTSSLGISKDRIPPGQGHLYVLKSQVVPPTTCPICPTVGVGGGGSSGGGGGGGNLEDTGSGLSNGLGSAFSSNGGGSSGGSSKCPPCPACARCPEPSFDCKKVPNYSIGQNGAMGVPRPVLADFSQFGM